MICHGFIKVGAASPKIKVGDCKYNAEEIINLTAKASKNQISILVFPELSITGYTCADLFLQRDLIHAATKSLIYIANKTKDSNTIIITGLPIENNGLLFNVAAVIYRGEIKGLVTKTFLPDYGEFYEKRWFSSGSHILPNTSIDLDSNHTQIPLGSNILFKLPQGNCNFGIEICEDLWAPIPPSSILTLKGADIIFNLSASNELIGKENYRRDLVKQQSARCICGYIYAGASMYESSTDTAFSGSCLIAENGYLLTENKNLFSTESIIIYDDLDLEIIRQERIKNKSFADSQQLLIQNKDIRIVKLNHNSQENITHDFHLTRAISKTPFFSYRDEKGINKICSTLVNIQTAALGKRLLHTAAKNTVIGISGGLDSTLALLSLVETYKKLDLDPNLIHTITMPGFGTSDRTYKNAAILMELLGTSSQEISITDAVLQHFNDINHDHTLHDLTYENSQARERTQILMDFANMVNGLVIGTGDLSELALGWCTYNGDQMSMYSLNCGIPKTLVKIAVKWFADTIYRDTPIADVLCDILDTPVSPELLPTNEGGNIAQKTEDVIGPYELHDFFLFYILRYGISAKKIFFLACKAFDDKYEKKIILSWLETFYHRFFSQQFKRSAMPDGPKVGSISLSPRTDWKMSSDASASVWLQELKEIRKSINIE